MFKFTILILTFCLLSACQNGTSGGGSSISGPEPSSGKADYFVEFKEKMEIPDDFFVMEGFFQVKKLGNNYGLYLRPIPLETKTMLFGPEIKGGLQVQADMFSAKSGRTYPSFGIGSHGISGLQLRFSQNRKGGVLQLIYNETQLLSSSECEWTTDQWSRMKMKVVPAGKNKEGRVIYDIYGKCWTLKEKEPGWQIHYKGDLVLDEGQSSIIGIPYSGAAIFYDNLTIYKN